MTVMTQMIYTLLSPSQKRSGPAKSHGEPEADQQTLAAGPKAFIGTAGRQLGRLLSRLSGMQRSS
jgi:hypothetical protein